MTEYGELWLPHVVIKREGVEEQERCTLAVFMSDCWLHDCVTFVAKPTMVIPCYSSYSHVDALYCV